MRLWTIHAPRGKAHAGERRVLPVVRRLVVTLLVAFSLGWLIAPDRVAAERRRVASAVRAAAERAQWLAAEVSTTPQPSVMRRPVY
jgi:hypothetical protein